MHCQLNQWNFALDPHTLATLQNMLYTLHPGVQIYKQAFELTRNLPPEQQCRIRLHFDPSTDRRCYQLPDASVEEVAILLLGDGEVPTGSQDIILHRNFSPPLQHIFDSNSMYPSLHYVLLFSTSQLSWHHKLPYNALEEGDGDANNKYITMMEYYHYHLHIHPFHHESIHLFLSGKLFQEFVYEIWAVTEQNCLSFLKHN